MFTSQNLKSKLATVVLGFFIVGVATVQAQPTAPAGSGGLETAVPPTSEVSTNPTFLRDVQPLILGKCARCHNSEGSFLPDWTDYKTAYAHREEIKRRVWDSWKGQYFKQAMPAGNCQECQTITEADRALFREWVDNGAPLGTAPQAGGPKTKAERVQLGKRLFVTMCATCHQAVGQGIANKYPPLAGSDFLNADKNQAIRILIHGKQGDIVVNGQKYDNVMPAFPLSDDDIANALTYTYNNFGNSGKEVTPEEVKALRAEKYSPVNAGKPAKDSPNQFE